MTKKNKRRISSKRVALTQITQKKFFIHSVNNTLVCDQLEIEEIIFARLKLNKARKF